MHYAQPNGPLVIAFSKFCWRTANPNCFTKAGAETGGFMRDCRARAETPLHRAAAFGTEETIQILLDAGVKIDAKDMDGDTPLSWASWYLRPDAIAMGNFKFIRRGDPCGRGWA